MTVMPSSPAPGDPLVPAVARVRDTVRETHDTFTLTLEGEEPFAFLPGQFNMLYAFGVGEAAVSLSGDPQSRTGAVHTIRAVGSVTNALAGLEHGDPVGLRGPFGSHWPVDEARGGDLVVVAGGIGLAPLRPVLYDVLARRGEFGRVTLLYGARSPSDLLYLRELEDWQAGSQLRVLVSVDHPGEGWDGPLAGTIGPVTVLFAEAEFDPGRTVGMMCGPEVMMRFVERAFAERGVPSERLYLSLERNMQCAVGFCGHCQFGPEFVCMDGPVFRHDRIRHLLDIREA